MAESLLLVMLVLMCAGERGGGSGAVPCSCTAGVTAREYEAAAEGGALWPYFSSARSAGPHACHCLQTQAPDRSAH